MWCSLRESDLPGTNTSTVRSVVRIGGDHLLRSALELAWVCHWRSGARKGSIDWVCKRMGCGWRRILRIGILVYVATSLRGVRALVGCTGWVGDAIVARVEDDASVGMTVVN